MAAVELVTDRNPEADSPQADRVPGKRRQQYATQSLNARQLPWFESFWIALNGYCGTGFGFSFAIHALVFSLLAIPVYQRLRQPSVISTRVENAPPEPNLITTQFDAETLLALPQDADGGTNADQLMVTEFGPSLTELPRLAPATAAPGEEGEPGNGDGLGGLRLREPKNAVKAGNFTVFTLPIALGSETVEAGQAPQPGQDYFIVVQVALPKGRTVYPLRDLSGTITGTDGYKQKIPEKAFAMSADKQLTPLSPRRGVPVLDGVAQVFIKVPGAREQVRDTIQVRSALLKEEQELVLTFE